LFQLFPAIQDELLAEELNSDERVIAGYRFYKKDGIWYPVDEKGVENLLFGKWEEFLDANDGKAILFFWDSGHPESNKSYSYWFIPHEIKLLKEINKAFKKKKGIEFPLYGFEVKD